jgi:hypothetical protein
MLQFLFFVGPPIRFPNAFPLQLNVSRISSGAPFRDEILFPSQKNDTTYFGLCSSDVKLFELQSKDP